MNLLVSDLVLVQRSTGNAIEVAVTSGRTGEPVADASVELWQLDWQKGHHVRATRTAAADGTAGFDLTGPGAVVSAQDWRSHQLALLVRHRGDTSLAAQVPWSIVNALPVTRSSLVYTDRSVYRPQQKLLWKVVAYEGGGEESRFRTSPRTSLTVELLDANNTTVETRHGRHQRLRLGGRRVHDPFRTAARPVARAQLAARRGRGARRGIQAAHVRGDAARPRAGGPAQSPGEPARRGPLLLRAARHDREGGLARDAAGRPALVVRPAGVAASIRRAASSRAGKPASAPTAASRSASRPRRTPRPRATSPGPTRVEATVTDEGGETRSATRRLRLGFVSVTARISDLPGFILAGRAASLPILRTDLDGAPRAGAATWTVVALQQPAKTLLPAEQPVPAPAGRADAGAGYRTPGDDMRPRSDPRYVPSQVLRLWTEGSTVGRGTLTHDAKGEAVLALPSLSAGAYRLHYETKDAFGATYEMTQDLVVAQPRQTPLALPGLLAVEHSSVPVGGTARLLVHSGLPGQRMTLEIWRGGRRTEVRHLVSGRSADVLELPVAEKDRGGFGVTLTLVRDHQLVQQAAEVFVPWQDRTLDVAFSTFRDKLRPGDRETWRITVTSKGPQREATAVAEVLASMYDRSLDLFAPHVPVNALSIYPNRTTVGWVQANLGAGRAVWSEGSFALGASFRRSAAGSPGLLERLRHRRTGTAADVPGNRRRRGRRRRGAAWALALPRPWRP